jgi:hypothetical protein
MSDRPGEWDAVENPPTALEMSIIKRIADSGYDLAYAKRAAIEAGVAPGQAVGATNRALRKIANNPLFQKALKRQGVTMETMAKKLLDLMNAKHPQFPEHDDNMAQIKALDMAMKAHEVYPSLKVDIEKNETHQIIISAEIIHAVEKAKGIKVIDVLPEPVKGSFE